MICPYCEKTMEKGFIQSNGTAMLWGAKKHRFTLFAARDGEIDLAHSLTLMNHIEAFCCKDCAIILVDYYKDDEEDEQEEAAKAAPALKAPEEPAAPEKSDSKDAAKDASSSPEASGTSDEQPGKEE